MTTPSVLRGRNAVVRTVDMGESGGAGGSSPVVPLGGSATPVEGGESPNLKEDVTPPHRERVRVPYTAVLPMCICEFLSFSILRAVLPRMLDGAFGGSSYTVEGATLAVQGLLAFGCCPIFGAVSDRYGRRVCLAFCAVGMCLPSISALLTGSMVVFQVFSALSGMFKGTFVVVFAYVADSVPPGPKRTSAYGTVLGTLGGCFTVGPTVGGYVATWYGNNAAFLLCASLGLLAAIYAILLLPESLPASKRAHHQGPHDWASLNPLRVLQRVCSDPLLARLMVIVFLYYVSYWGLVPHVMLYVTRRFGFLPAESGRVLGIVGGCSMTSELVIVRLLLRAGVSDWTLLRLGLAGWAFKCVCFSFANDRSLVYAASFLSLVSGLFGPSLTAIAAAAGTQRGKTGEVLGAVSALRALAEGAGPLLSGYLLQHYEKSDTPGRPYLFVGMLSVAAYAVTYTMPAPQSTQDSSLPFTPEGKTRRNHPSPRPGRGRVSSDALEVGEARFRRAHGSGECAADMPASESESSSLEGLGRDGPVACTAQQV
eukprot:Hpha_TRINITY_DN8942_c0_g1::TRINITY_DN8942_c0_g1_i1::g.80923::m.80923